MSDAAPTPPLRVLHLPALVGGHAAGLARGERELGLDSRTLALVESPYGYEADVVLFPPGLSRAAREWRRWRAAFGELRQYDVVHFNFGSTLMPARHPQSPAALRLYAALTEGLDLRLLPRRTAVFVTYQGDDARQRQPRFEALPADYFDPAVDAAKRRSIARLARRADGIFALNPDLLDVLPPSARWLAYASVDPREWKPIDPRLEGVPVVVHAPTDRAVKGTDQLVAAVDRLRSEGVEVELVLVEGVTRKQARSAYEQADVVVDQLVTGWYGGISVEAMALGKPVVAYVADEDAARAPANLVHELPIVRATSDSVHAVLRELLTTRRGELVELGRRGRSFVERWHDPVVVARTTADAYTAAVRRRAITTTSTNSPST